MNLRNALLVAKDGPRPRSRASLKIIRAEGYWALVGASTGALFLEHVELGRTKRFLGAGVSALVDS